MQLIDFTSLIDVSEIVPDQYETFRPAIRDAAFYFLEQLTESRRDEILGAQAALPPGAPTAQRIVALMHASPSLHKLGQVVARHGALDPAFRARLQQLEMFHTTIDHDIVRDVTLEELGDAVAKYDIALEIEGTIEASVAFVVPATWRRPGCSTPERAMLKVVKPGLADKLAEELDVLVRVADYLDDRRAHYGIPAFQYRETFSTVRDLLHGETELLREQRNLRVARKFFARSPDVKVPGLLPFCTPRLTAMERIDGARVTDVERDPSASKLRRRLAKSVVESLIADVIFSRAAATIFHADPHAGNLFAMPDGRLALLDWSLAGQVDKRQRELMAEMFLGAISLSTRRVTNAVRALATAIDDEARAREVVRASLRQVRRDQVPGPSWFTDLFEDLMANGVRFPANLVLLRKSLFTLEGVVKDIDPDCSIRRVFLREALLRLALEWPRRYISLPWSKSFATHISNADLVRLYLGTPITIAKYLRHSLTNPNLGADSDRDPNTTAPEV